MHGFTALVFLVFATLGKCQRYLVTSLESDHLIYATRPFRVAFVPANRYSTPVNTAVTWTLPIGCSAVPRDAFSVSLTVTCANPGLLSFSYAYPGSTAAFSVQVKQLTHCYSWKLKTGDNSHVFSGKNSALLWISGLNEQAASAQTKMVTRSFHVNGNQPIIKTSLTTLSLVYEMAIDAWVWSYNATKTGLFEVKVSDKHISVMGCSVDESDFRVYVSDPASNPEFVPAVVDFSVLPASKYTTRDLVLRKNACVGTTVFATSPVLFGNGVVLFSESGLAGLKTYNVGQTIVDYAVTKSGWVLLTPTSVFYSKGTNGLLASSFKNPTVWFNKVRSSGGCFDLDLQIDSIQNELIMLWSTTSCQKEFQFSLDGGKSFSAVPTGGCVRDIGYIGSMRILLVYSIDTTPQVERFVVSQSGAVSLDGVYKVTLVGDAFKYSIGVVPFGGNFVYLYGDQMYVSPDGGISFLQMGLLSQGLPSVLATAESFVYMRFDQSEQDGGSFVATTSTNRVFFGFSGIGSIHELPSGLAADEDGIATFYDDLIEVGYKNGTGIASILVNPEEYFNKSKCPFTSWKIGVYVNGSLSESKEVVIDRNEKTLVGVQVESLGAIRINIAHTNASIVDTVISSGERSLNLSLSSRSQIGRDDVTIQAEGGIECHGVSRVFTTWIGCPLNRHIRFVYSDLARNKWTNQKCPNCEEEKYYSYVFIPRFQLWDGDRFVANIAADITLSEKTGKQNYQFVLNNKIINGTNGNGLVWNGGKDELYTFVASVVDPNYSFCLLETEFSVRTFGAPMDPGAQAGIIIGMTSFLLIILLGSYYWFAQNVVKENKEEHPKAE